jgi:acyl-CoA thioesterase-1
MRGVNGNRRSLLAALTVAALLLPGCASLRPADTILVVGDSLSAGYGLQPGTGWAWLLVPRLSAEQIEAKVVNVSVSGRTTVTGRSNIEAQVGRYRPTVVVIEMGADDVFDGVPLTTVESDLLFMVKTAQQAGARVLLVGVKVPSKYSPAYQAEFARIYSAVAASTGSALVLDFLDRVANAPDVAQLFQADNTHPNAQGQPILLANVWPGLRKLLR